ncbi:MAG: hypothetical protein NC337_16080 [Roseburia sp.]|nr:hypothetical protein [Roseburia sp.]
MKTKKMMLAAMALTCALALSACGNKNKTNENKDPLTGEDMSQTDESSTEDSSGENGGDNGNNGNDSSANADEFDRMINDENTDPNNIISYINTNIVSAGAEDVKHFFSGLLGFGDDIRSIDFAKLEDSRKYMSEDMVAFMDLMKLEGESPSMAMSDKENRRVINMTLTEMLERALLFENHLRKYPNDVTTEAAAKLYEEIATNAISGGYDKAQGIAHYYKGDSDDTINQEALEYYQKFVNANEGSNLAGIVEEYIGLLQSNQFKINDSMESFYASLHDKLNVAKWNSGTNNTNGTTTGNTNNSNTNGTTTGNTNNSGTNGTTTGNTNNSNTNGTTTGNKNNSTAGNQSGSSDTVIQGTVTR